MLEDITKYFNRYVICLGFLHCLPVGWIHIIVYGYPEGAFHTSDHDVYPAMLLTIVLSFSVIHLCRACIRCVDKQPRLDLRWLPHVVRLLSAGHGIICCNYESLEANKDILLWVSYVFVARCVFGCYTLDFPFYCWRSSCSLWEVGEICWVHLFGWCSMSRDCTFVVHASAFNLNHSMNWTPPYWSVCIFLFLFLV